MVKGDGHLKYKIARVLLRKSSSWVLWINADYIGAKVGYID